jgi:hypothetical protein
MPGPMGAKRGPAPGVATVRSVWKRTLTTLPQETGAPALPTVGGCAGTDITEDVEHHAARALSFDGQCTYVFEDKEIEIARARIEHHR